MSRLVIEDLSKYDMKTSRVEKAFEMVVETLAIIV